MPSPISQHPAWVRFPFLATCVVAVVFAVAGIGLLAAGATFEQRRADLRRVRDAFAELD